MIDYTNIFRPFEKRYQEIRTLGRIQAQEEALQQINEMHLLDQVVADKNKIGPEQVLCMLNFIYSFDRGSFSAEQFYSDRTLPTEKLKVDAFSGPGKRIFTCDSWLDGLVKVFLWSIEHKKIRELIEIEEEKRAQIC